MKPRLGELLGAETCADDGTSLGKVKDVRLVQDGPYVEGFGNALRVAGLVIGGRNLGIRMGFARAEVRGPWPLTILFRALERRAGYYAWDEVATWEPGLVRLRPGATASEPPS